MRFYSDELVQKNYLMKDALSDIHSTLNSLKNGLIKYVDRAVIESNNDDVMLYMPCIDLDKGYSAVKTISIFPNNPKFNLPTSQAVTLLSELKTGRHLAVIESSYLTRLRTGAMTGLATKRLAAPDAQVLGIIGTGGMAFEQALGVLEVMDIQQILLFNRTIQKAYDFKKRLLEFGITVDIKVYDNVNEVVHRSEIINCATKSTEAVFEHSDIRKGTHINGLGSYLPSMREINEATIANANIIVLDDILSAQHEAGEFIAAAKEGTFNWNEALSLSNLVEKDDLVRNENDITIFKSVGTAYYDLSVAIGAYEKLK